MLAKAGDNQPLSNEETQIHAKRNEDVTVSTTAAQSDSQLVHTPAGLSIKRPSLVRVLVQALTDLGYSTSAQVLEHESGVSLEEEFVRDFRTGVLDGNWDSVVSLLPQLGMSQPQIPTAKLLIAQQRYLELLEKGNVAEALLLLRENIAPGWPDNQQKLFHLSSLVMYNGSDVFKHADTPADQKPKDLGSGKTPTETARLSLLSKLQEWIPPKLLVPRQRLLFLLDQSLQHQISNCLSHNPNSHTSFSVLRDHSCLVGLPQECIEILEGHTDEVLYVAFSHDGTRLASASRDKSVVVWFVTPEAHARQQTAALTRAEKTNGNSTNALHEVKPEPAATAEDTDADSGQDSGEPGAEPSASQGTASASARSATQEASLARRSNRPALLSGFSAPRGRRSSHSQGGRSGHSPALPLPPTASPPSASSPITPLPVVSSASTSASSSTSAPSTAPSSDSSPPSAQEKKPYPALSNGVRMEGHSGICWHVCWSPDDRHLLTCASDNTVKCYSVETGECVLSLASHSEPVMACAWCDNEHFVSGSVDKNVILWDLKGQALFTWRDSIVQDLVVTPDGHRVVMAATSNSIFVYNLHSKAKETQFSEQCPITSISVSDDSKHILVSTTSPPEVHMWDLLTGTMVRSFDGFIQSRYVIRATFGGSPTQSFVVSGSEDSQIYVWNRHSGELIAVLSGHSGPVNSVCWSPTAPSVPCSVGKRQGIDYVCVLASASDDHTIRLWGYDPSSSGAAKPILPSRAMNRPTMSLEGRPRAAQWVRDRRRSAQLSDLDDKEDKEEDDDDAGIDDDKQPEDDPEEEEGKEAESSQSQSHVLLHSMLDAEESDEGDGAQPSSGAGTPSRSSSAGGARRRPEAS